jgi:hypothetical protein
VGRDKKCDHHLVMILMFQLNNDSSDNMKARSVVRALHSHFLNAFSQLFFVSAPLPQVLALRALNRLFLFVSAKRVVAAVSNSATNTFLSRSPLHFSTQHQTPHILYSIVSALTARSLDAITAAGPLIVTCIRRLPSLIPLQAIFIAPWRRCLWWQRLF